MFEQFYGPFTPAFFSTIFSTIVIAIVIAKIAKMGTQPIPEPNSLTLMVHSHQLFSQLFLQLFCQLLWLWWPLQFIHVWVSTKIAKMGTQPIHEPIFNLNSWENSWEKIWCEWTISDKIKDIAESKPSMNFIISSKVKIINLTRFCFGFTDSDPPFFASPPTTDPCLRSCIHKAKTIRESMQPDIANSKHNFSNSVFYQEFKIGQSKQLWESQWNLTWSRVKIVWII